MVETQKPDNYILDETPVIINVKQEANSYSVTATKNGNSVITGPTEGIYTIKVTNKLETVGINVLKVDSKNNTKLLEGAEFKLTTLKNGNYVPYPDSNSNTFTTNAAGRFASDIQLPIGFYKLTETGAPTNYVLPTEEKAVEFQVVRDGQALKVDRNSVKKGQSFFLWDWPCHTIGC